jgi:hypothetical protein
MTARDIAMALGCKTPPDANGNYTCCCPGPLHKNGDRNPSLSIKDGRNSRLLFHCFVGCTYREIIAGIERRGICVRGCA